MDIIAQVYLQLSTIVSVMNSFICQNLLPHLVKLLTERVCFKGNVPQPILIKSPSIPALFPSLQILTSV